MIRPIRVSPRAQAQIEAASEWWCSNRPAAPTALDDDLAGAFDLIRDAPGIGQPVEHAKHVGVRRLTLHRVRYHLYYRVADDVIEVLALWHTARGSEPTV